MEFNSLGIKKFIFITGSSGREKLMVKIAKELTKSYKSDCHFLSLAAGNTKDFFISERIDEERVYCVHNELNKKNKLDLEFLRNREEKYGFNLFDLWQIAAPRRKSRLKIKGDKILSDMEYILRNVENVVSNVKPDYVFMTGISAYQYVICYKIFNEKKIPVLELVNARIPGKFTFDNELKSKWPLLVKCYNQVKKEGLDENEREKAQIFLDNFKNKPFKPDDSTKVKESFRKKAKKYNSYVKTLYYRKCLPDLRPFFWYPLKDRLIKNSSRFEQPVGGEKFVFFPLQIQPEASTSIRGKWFSNQLSLIENISRSLPCNYKLYVKEHVRNFSKRPFRFHKEIKKFPNVRLITPFAKTIDLIKKSSLVTTITGTVGWEAVILQKPVITFGEVFYNVFDEVDELSEISKLPMLIEKKLGKVVDIEKTLQFISSIQNSTFKGVGALPGDCQNRSIDDENIVNIIKGIEKYISRMGI
jgi:hypothetical protein